MYYIRRPTPNYLYDFQRLNKTPPIDDWVHLEPLRRHTIAARRTGKNRYLYIPIMGECFRQTVTVVSYTALSGWESTRDQQYLHVQDTF
jgi:hypothetical protein